MRFLIPLLLLGACEVEPEAEDALAAFDEAMEQLAPPPVVNGCGDVTVYLRNGADTTALVLEIPGIVAAANAAGGPIRQTMQLPDRRVTGELRMGRGVTSATCTGVIMPPGPRIRSTMRLDGGTLDVRATPVAGPPGMPLAAQLDITLTDPSFTGGGVGVAHAGTFTWPQVLGGGYYP
jgi:hypothetical protein